MSGYTDSHGSLTTQAMAGFFASSKDVFSDNKTRPRLVSRARYLHITSTISRAVHRCLVRGVIGSGLRYEPRLSSAYFEHYDLIAPILKRDFDMYSTAHLFDKNGRMTFTQLCKLVFETMILSGEAWLFRSGDCEWVIREPDYIRTPDSYGEDAKIVTLDNGNIINDGIEIGTDGTPIAVWYCVDPYAKTGEREYTRIPYFDDNGVPLVIHVFHTDRPGQVRGLPLTAPVIQNLWSTLAFCDSELQMAILQCNQSLIITTQSNASLNPFTGISPRDLDAPLIPPTPPSGDDKKPSDDFSILPPMASTIFDGLINKVNFVSPGQTRHLREGEDIKFLSPTAPSSTLTQFIDLQMRMIGAALGIPEQVLSGKFDANFSAVKGATSAFNHTVKEYRSDFIESFCKPFFEVFAYNEIIHHNWQGANGVLGAAQLLALESVWLPNDSPLVLDPNKEMDFYIKAVDAGLITRDEAAQALFSHPATGVVKDG